MASTRRIISMLSLLAAPPLLLMTAHRVLLQYLAASPAVMAQATPSPSETASTLILLGLDPDSLAAAGVTPGAVPTIVESLQGELTAAPGTLFTLISEHGQRRAEVDRLQRIIRSGRGELSDLDALPAAVQHETSAAAALDQATSNLRLAATEGLPESAIATLATLRTHRPEWNAIDTAFLVVERTDSEWAELRDALASRRIAQQSGEEVSQQATETIASAAADLAVQQALSNSEVNGAGIAQAWLESVG